MRGWLMALALLGCTTSRAPRDAPCQLNSDCAEHLVCADQICRGQCREDRDCAPGWSCGASGSPNVYVCLPPASPLLCAFSSECPPGAQCVEARCRFPCTQDADCPDTATCADGVCSNELVHAADGGAGVITRGDGGLACGMGRTPCGDACVDLANAPDHCGACGVACPPNERCAEGACVCLAPHLVCGSACADTSNDAAHCGECFAACEGICRDGTCCGDGRAYCGGSCIDVDTDELNCGDCGRTCSPRQECRSGVCVFENDRCLDAEPMVLEPGIAVREVYAGVGEFYNDVQGCHFERDVFVAFTLTERSVVAVFAQTNLGTHATGWAPEGAPPRPRRCSYRSCSPGTVLVDVLEPGVHRVAIEAPNDSASLFVHHVPIGDAPATEIFAGELTVSGTTSGASGAGTSSPGPEHALYWVTCSYEGEGELTVTTCGAETTFDSALELVSSDEPMRLIATDDPSCAPGATLTATMTRRRGLYVVFVDGQTADAMGSFVVRGTRP
ncbi:MAG: hypothetical protein M5U28_20815 [Sandaracinaceae bacterium]|nr:hypothetical protein [Sandaracinaceae bacterium]